jgi:hypothetical protein
VIDTESGAVVAEQERVVALIAGESVSGILEFAGDKFELKSYRITLRYFGQGEQKMLGETVLMIIDGTPPEIIILRPQAGETYAGMVKIEAEASDNASGVARLEYRIDEREWLEMPFFEATTGRHWASWEPIFQEEGEHKIRLRAVDGAGNSAEAAPVAFAVQMGKVPPGTDITIGDPKLLSGENVFVSDKTSFTLNATADSGSVTRAEYRIDQGAWQIYATPFALADLADGEHTIRYRSAGQAGNIEYEQALKVLIDSTPPQTSLSFQEGYMDGGRLLVSPQTEITLAATDNLTGVAFTQYRFDEEATWSNYFGAFRLADLPCGVHTLHHRSVDRVENEEAENSVPITLFGMEVATELLHRPRVLVWTEDPEELNGNNRPAWTLEEVRALIEEALGVPNLYFSLTTEKDDFRQAFRSGIFNVTMIIRQDIQLDTVFLREMREAVNRGTGLLVSTWGNSVPPLWQDIFGIDFKGSLTMDAAERSLHLYAGPLSDEQTLTAAGRVLKTTLDGGTLGGIVLGESACEGVRGLTLHYPVTIQSGDQLTATLFVPRGKKSILVEEETLTVGELPVGPVSRFTGNAAGDLVIAAITAEGVDLALSGAYGFLEAAYLLTIAIDRADGSTENESVNLSPTCGASLRAGMNLGPFRVTAVDEDGVQTGADPPAVVLSRYGEGRTAFFSYNLIESALNGQRSEHLALLRKAGTYLLPEAVQPEAAGIVLLETRIRLQGAGLEVQAAETLGEGLTHLPLFDLTQSPLSFHFHLEAGKEAAWRYFVRLADRQGDFAKTTAVALELEGEYVTLADWPTGFSVEDDSRTLLQKALAWVDGQLATHSEEAEALQALREVLIRIDSQPRNTPAAADQTIHETVQTIHQALQLGFDAGELRKLLDDYLRVVEGEGYFTE